MSKKYGHQLQAELNHAKIQYSIWKERADWWIKKCNSDKDINPYHDGRYYQAKKCAENWKNQILRLEKLMKESGVIQRV